MKTVKTAIILLLIVLPALVFAQQIVPHNPTPLPGNSSSKIIDLVQMFINIALAIVGITAVAFLIYGGFRYITSAGNEEASETAKKVIKNSIIGLIIVVLSYIIVITITNALLPQIGPR
ncbi:MAG: hypothetical protein Q8P83_04025 [bacterium]|nr:hypothetical protein [bacterium]